MGNKKTRVTYQGMNKDIAKSKFQDGLYYNAENMKLTPVEGQSFGVISNAYGNKKALALPSPTIDTENKKIIYGYQELSYYNDEISDMKQESGPQIIIGDVPTKDGFLLFSTDNDGFDCIWEVEDINREQRTIGGEVIEGTTYSDNRTIFDEGGSGEWTHYKQYGDETELVTGGTSGQRCMKLIDGVARWNLDAPPSDGVNWSSTAIGGTAKMSFDIKLESPASNGRLLVVLGQSKHASIANFFLKAGDNGFNPLNGGWQTITLEHEAGLASSKVLNFYVTVSGITSAMLIDNIKFEGTITTSSGGVTEEVEVDELPYKLLYTRDLGFSSERPIQAVFNYENDIIQKVYWVDGDNYLRFLNTRQSIENEYLTDLIDLDASSINSKSTFETSQPVVTDGGTGGVHTSGVIQYAYSLYNLNGAETSISPMSNSFPIGKGTSLGGGDLNEIVGTMPVVGIPTLDRKYNYIKLYSIKYTSFNETPAIKVILDSKIGKYEDFSFNDVGNVNLGNLGKAEFLFLGADPIKPSSIALKDNILFAANNKSTAYILDIDTRAYSYNKKGDFALLHDTVEYVGKPSPTVEGAEAINFQKIGISNISYSDISTWGDVTSPEATPTVNISTLDPKNMSQVDLLEYFPALYAQEQDTNSQLVPFWGKSSLNAAILADLNNIPKDFDAVNLDFDTYRYRKAGSGFSAVYQMITGALIAGEAVGNSVSLNLYEQHGEGVIIDNVINNNVTGTVSIDFDITLNMRTTAQSGSSLLKLILKKNGIAIGNYFLNTSAGGINTKNYKLTADVLEEDTLTFEIVPVSSIAVLDIGITGVIDITEVEAESGTGTEGGSGKYISYSLTSNVENGVNSGVDKFFKDGEIYRIGILFYNSLGQETEAKWIADFKAPIGNLKGNYNTIEITLEDAFIEYIDTLPEEEKPTGYTVLRAIRGANDRTIVGQGMLTGMMTQVSHPGKDEPKYWNDKSGEYFDDNAEAAREEANKSQLKSPIPMTRGFFNEKLENGTSLGAYNPREPWTWNGYNPVWPYKHNRLMVFTKYVDRTQGGVPSITAGEIHEEPAGDLHAVTSWQYNKMMQLHTPEAVFKMPIFTTGTDELSIIGVVPRESFKYTKQEINRNTDVIVDTYEEYLTGEENVFSFGAVREYSSGILIGPPLKEKSGDSNYEDLPVKYRSSAVSELAQQMHTRSTFGPLISNKKNYNIYGKPEITEVGQGPKFYNGDHSFKYCNHLKTIATDVQSNGYDRDQPGVSGVYSEGNRCLTLVLGNDSAEEINRPSLDGIFSELLDSDASVGGDWNVELMAEIKRKRSFIYSGAIYGGYSYNARSTTEYTTMGSTFSIATRKAHIHSPGDTFVQVFKNTRLTKTPVNTYSNLHPIVIETLEYLVESSVNLELRNDTSILDKGLVDPTSEEANKYNRVYSTDATVKVYTADNTKLKALEVFPTEVIASKTKIPGEFIDNWVDFRPNEVQYLDGKYGAIHSLVPYRDELYTFQDSAISKLSINPRIQTQGQDGVSIELGSGSVLQDYFYLTTTTGAINKWGIIPTNSGIYYMDAKSKVMNLVEGNQILAPSETKGMHSFLYKNLDTADLSIDNPIIGHGISAGVDYINGDIFMTVKKGEEAYTLGFNEKLKTYTSFYSFTPSRYITKGEKIFTVSPNNNEVWEHYDGNYQNYYGTKYESNVTLLINTDDVSAEKVFNSIEFDSEVTLEGVDIAGSTIDSIEAWTDYQKSGKIELIVGKTVKRRLRTWRASIPRSENSRARLKDKWVFLKLGFNPDEDKKLILHDIIMGYSQQ